MACTTIANSGKYLHVIAYLIQEYINFQCHNSSETVLEQPHLILNCHSCEDITCKTFIHI